MYPHANIAHLAAARLQPQVNHKCRVNVCACRQGVRAFYIIDNNSSDSCELTALGRDVVVWRWGRPPTARDPTQQVQGFNHYLPMLREAERRHGDSWLAVSAPPTPTACDYYYRDSSQHYTPLYYRPEK